MSHHRTRVDVVPLYSQFALRDWLVEPSPDDIHPVVQTALRHGVACDGLQIIVGSESTRPVSVQLELWAQAPHVDSPEAVDQWEEHHSLHLECPSGNLYIDQLTATAIDLTERFPLHSGTYGVHLYWRGRVTRASEPEDGGGRSPEQYLVRMWRSGELSAATMAEYGEDPDED